MIEEETKQRYTYFFIDRATNKIKYATVAYSFNQAVEQIKLKNPSNANTIQAYVDNHGFDYDKKAYVPKEAPPKPNQSQMSFKDFDKNVWPNV